MFHRQNLYSLAIHPSKSGPFFSFCPNFLVVPVFVLSEPFSKQAPFRTNSAKCLSNQLLFLFAYFSQHHSTFLDSPIYGVLLVEQHSHS